MDPPNRSSLLSVQGTLDGEWAAIQDMRVDHGRRHVPMAEKILHGPDIVAIFEHVRGERVAQSVGRDVFVDLGQPG